MLVRSVESVVVEILESFPPRLRVTVQGTAATGGWTGIALQPAISINPTLLALELVGTPPSGMATEVISPVSAEYTQTFSGPLPTSVIVYAATNNVSVPVSPASPRLSDGMGLQGPPGGYSEMEGIADYRAVRLGSEVHIRASGELGYITDFADLRQLPIRIYPPEFGFFVYRAGVGLPTTRKFGFVSRFAYPPNEPNLTIHDAAGRHSIPIHDPSLLPLRTAIAASGSSATGYGATLQEAVDHAIVQLPPPHGDGADILYRYSVLDQGKLVGGFVGFDTFYAEVELHP